MSELKHQTITGIKWLVIITVIIILLNILSELLGNPSWQIERLIHVGRESNFPTWFSSLLWAIAAYMAYKCYKIAKDKKLPSKIWILISFFLLFLSCDEVAMMHENFGGFIDRHFFKLNLNTSWAIIFSPVILAIIFYLSFNAYKSLKESKKAAKFMLIGILLFVFGSMILEQSTSLPFYKHSVFLRRTETILEEFLEMLGAILIIKGLIEHCKFLLTANGQRESLAHDAIRTNELMN